MKSAAEPSALFSKTERIMLKKNDIYTIEITGYGSRGEGIGRIKEMVVFVPYTVVGDVISVRIVKVLQSYCYGKLEQVLQASTHRITPKCEAFGLCGGCQVMQMEYEEQLRMKQQMVQDCISRIGKLNCIVKRTLPAQRQYHYRNKVQIPVGVDKQGKLITGFYRMGSHDIIPHIDCKIEPKQAKVIKKTVIDWMQQYHILPFNEQKRTGNIRHIYIRFAEGTGEIMVVLVTYQKKLPFTSELVQMLLNADETITTVVQNVQPQPNNVILGKKNYVLWGPGKIRDQVDGLQFLISPNSFYQVNTRQMVQLYQTAFRVAQIQPTDTVFDLYCGTGTISLFASRYAKKVIGVELVPEAVEDAKENMQINGVTNCVFYQGDAADVTKRLYESGERADIVLVDPPRKGCSQETIQLLADLAPRKLVYISCNPATLARDLRLLQDRGYWTEQVQPVDLFLHSAHVETVCLLSKLNAKQHIEINLDMDELDLTDAEKKATYQEIKDYVLEHSGLKVSSLYIAQVKQKCGIIERENYNKPKSEDAKQPQCPPDKEKAIKEALKHFGMI